MYKTSTLSNSEVFAMEQCVRAVRAWMVVDKLKLNEEKTEFMLIGTHQQTALQSMD